MSIVKTDAIRARDACGPGGLLTLDIAGRTGWAYGQLGGAPFWGFEQIARDGADPGAVFARYDAWLRYMLVTLTPSDVFAEMPFINPRLPNAVMRLAGYKAVTQMRCFAEDRRLRRFVPPKEITAFFTGRGHWLRDAKKDATIAVCGLYGWNVGLDDDAADALALFVFGENEIDVATGALRAAAVRKDSSLLI